MLKRLTHSELSLLCSDAVVGRSGNILGIRGRSTDMHQCRTRILCRRGEFAVWGLSASDRCSVGDLQ